MKRMFLYWLALNFSALCFSVNLHAAPTNDQWQHERREWTLDLPQQGAVDVANPWGDIRVRTHDQNKVYVLANIQHHQDDPRTMNLVVDNESGDQLGLTAHFNDDGTTSIAQGSTAQDWQPRRIDLTVFVPARQTLALTTDKGLIEVRGLHAPLTVKTRTGDIRLRIKGALQAYSDYGDIQSFFLRTDWSRDASIETLTGGIEVLIPQGGNATVKAQTYGQITTDFSINIQRDAAEEQKTATAKIGKRGKTLTLKSDRGAIKLLSSVIPDESK